MTNPHIVACADLDSIPSYEHLAALASSKGHVALRLPPSTDQARLSTLVDELRQRLPAFKVFASGSNEPVVAIMRVVTDDVVMAQARELFAAALAFRTCATELTTSLATLLELEVLDESTRFGLGRRGRGTLDRDWEYYFHGHECCFTHRQTGQTLDVQLEFAGEFGALDPWFFHRFLETTEEYRHLTALLPDAFHDTARALDVLVHAGILKSAFSPRWGSSAPVALPE